MEPRTGTLQADKREARPSAGGRRAALLRPLACAGAVCPLCGGAGEALGEKDTILLRVCRCVGETLLAWAWESEEAYENFYVDDALYHEHEQRANFQSSFWQRDSDHLGASAARLRMLEVLRPRDVEHHNVLVDIGAGTGAFASLAQYAYYYDAFGIEPNPQMVCQGKALGRPVFQGTWKNVVSGADIFHLSDVLEHLLYPLECLSHLRNYLHIHGMIVVEIPEWGCRQAKQDGIRWRHVRPRQHLAMPDETAIREWFARCDLEIEAVVRPLRGEIGKVAYYLSSSP